MSTTAEPRTPTNSPLPTVFSAISSLASPQQLRRSASLQRRLERWSSPPQTPSPTWIPLKHQRMPDLEGTWDVWLVLAGRGTGKTLAGANAVLEHLNRVGAIARVGIGAPTTADVRDVCA